MSLEKRIFRSVIEIQVYTLDKEEYFLETIILVLL